MCARRAEPVSADGRRRRRRVVLRRACHTCPAVAARQHVAAAGRQLQRLGRQRRRRQRRQRQHARRTEVSGHLLKTKFIYLFIFIYFSLLFFIYFIYIYLFLAIFVVNSFFIFFYSRFSGRSPNYFVCNNEKLPIFFLLSLFFVPS